jgi:hypothetical protein
MSTMNSAGIQTSGTAVASTCNPAIEHPILAGSENSGEQSNNTLDLTNYYPDTRLREGDATYAITRTWFTEQRTNSTRIKLKNPGDVAKVEFHQHTLRWRTGLGLQIGRDDSKSNISLDVDRGKLFRHSESENTACARARAIQSAHRVAPDYHRIGQQPTDNTTRS